MMSAKEKAFSLMVLVAFCVLFGAIASRSYTPTGAGAAALYRQSFTTVNQMTSTTVGTLGTVVLNANADRVYLSIRNEGALAASCVPDATTTNHVFGQGWYLAATSTFAVSGAVEFPSVVIYSGAVTCFTGSGTTTLGVVER